MTVSHEDDRGVTHGYYDGYVRSKGNFINACMVFHIHFRALEWYYTQRYAGDTCH